MDDTTDWRIKAINLQEALDKERGQYKKGVIVGSILTGVALLCLGGLAMLLLS